MLALYLILICKYKSDFAHAQNECAPEASSLQLQNPGNEAHLRYTVIQLQVSAIGTLDSLNYAIQTDPGGDRQLYFIVAYPTRGTLVKTVCNSIPILRC